MPVPRTPAARTLALTCVFVLAACHRSTPPEPAPGEPAAGGSAASVPAERVRRVATEEVVGTVRSRQSAAIAAKLTATILELNVWPGEIVKAGQVVGLLDAREPDARLAQARALLDQAVREESRVRSLAAQRAVASQDLDNAVSRREVAEAGLREAQTQASHARLEAPFDGVIVSRFAEAGDLAVPGRTLLVIENPAALRVEIQLPESLLGRLKSGEDLEVQVPSLDTVLRGRITEISPAADPVSRTFLVKADLPPVEGLRSGQFGRVRVPIGEVETIELPEEAVVRRGQMEMVYVFDEPGGVVRQRLVRCGRRADGRVEIVSGLEPGERVAVSGVGGMRDGATWKPLPRASGESAAPESRPEVRP